MFSLPSKPDITMEMMETQFTLKTLTDTADLAGRLATAWPAKGIVLLSGDLGAGKTSFARAFICARTGSLDLDVPSPTFTLVQRYDAPDAPVFHFDLYRLKMADEIFELGWEESCAEGFVLVEWPDRLGPYTPRNAFHIHIEGPLDDAGTRQVRVTS